MWYSQEYNETFHSSLEKLTGLLSINVEKAKTYTTEWKSWVVSPYVQYIII